MTTEVIEKDLNADGDFDLPNQAEDSNDLYSYTKRDEFTSEIYKIEIMNIPLHTGFSDLRKLLKQRLHLKPSKVKLLSGKQSMYAFITFRCEEDRVDGIEKISGFKWKNNELKAKKACPTADPYVQKRKLESQNNEDSKKTKLADNLTVKQRLKNAVTPLWEVTYSEQLKQKEADMRKLLMKLSYEIEKVNPSMKSLIKNRRDENEGLSCEFLGVKPSPVIDGYRNKCEFSIGFRECETSSSKLYTVGFRLSSYSDGSIEVVEPEECLNINSKMKTTVKCFQNYIGDSGKAPFSAESHEGFWRQLTVRTTRMNDIMVIIVMHPQQLTEEEIESEKGNLINYFSIGDGKSCGITSLYLQLLSKRISGEELPLYHLFGNKYIKEKLYDLTFNISPEAFFQVNTSGAEVLYSSIKEMANLNSNTTLLDICCGTGTIGLCLAENVSKVLGVELVSKAVEDAKENTLLNDVKNANFFCGKAEDLVNALIKRAPTDDIVAIVDPPRAGLHSRVVKVIRASPQIKRVIYVSCNPNAAKTNFIEFCRSTSNAYKGKPFIPNKAIAVDMFPHTPHCELIVEFCRFDADVTK